MFEKKITPFIFIGICFFALNLFGMNQGEQKLKNAQAIQLHLDSYYLDIKSLKARHNNISKIKGIELQYFQKTESLVKNVSPLMSPQDQENLTTKKDLEVLTCLCCACPRVWCYGINIRDSAYKMSESVGKHVKDIAEAMKIER